jgi:hypothetical protein
MALSFVSILASYRKAITYSRLKFTIDEEMHALETSFHSELKSRLNGKIWEWN